MNKTQDPKQVEVTIHDDFHFSLCGWWTENEDLRRRLIYRVWSRTSGQIHDASQIEKRMEDWIALQKKEERKKAKLHEWRLARQVWLQFLLFLL